VSSDFQQTAIWGGEAGGAQLEAPNGLDVDAAGNVYSTDFQSGYLRRFSPVRHFSTDGRLIGTVGSGLAAPHGTATGPSGDLYVAETMGAAIRTFTRGESS
jgi:streptogramin lyase